MNLELLKYESKVSGDRSRRISFRITSKKVHGTIPKGLAKLENLVLETSKFNTLNL